MARHWPFGLLLLIFTGLAVQYAHALPPFESSDERRHMAYVLHVRHTGQLPDPRQSDSPIRQQSGQPPLYYLSAVAWSHLKPMPAALDVRRNPYLQPIDPIRRSDNANVFMMHPDRFQLSAAQQASAAANRWLRWVSLPWAWLALVGVYGAGLQLWGRRDWALLGAMGLAFTPRFIQAAISVSNDGAAVTLSAWLLTVALALSVQPRRGTVLLAGLLMGLGVLAKISVVAVWPLPVLALVLNEWSRSAHAWRRLAGRLGVMLGVALAVCGWWLARGWTLADDPLGVAPHAQQAWATRAAPDWLTWVAGWPALLADSWGAWGWGYFLLPGWMISLAGALAGLGLAGLIARRRWSAHWLLSALMPLLGLVALWGWATVSRVVPGRLFLAYLPGLLVLSAGGLGSMAPPVKWSAAGVLGGLAASVVPLVIAPTYNPPPALTQWPDDLDGPTLDFGRLRLARISLTPNSLDDRQPLAVTLCWHTTGQPGQTIPVEAAYHLTLTDEAGQIKGQRYSYPGTGRFTRLPGDTRFCETLGLPVREPVWPLGRYTLALGWHTFGEEPLPPGLDGTPQVVAQLTAPAQPLTPAALAAAPFRVGDVYLVEQRLNAHAGQLVLDLVWGVVTPPADGARLVVEVYNARTQRVLRHETTLGPADDLAARWQPGQLGSQQLRLDMSGQPLDYYTVALSLEGPSGERVALYNGQGNRMPLDKALLGTVALEG